MRANLQKVQEFRFFLIALLLRVRERGNAHPFRQYFALYGRLQEESQENFGAPLSEVDFVKILYMALNAGFFVPQSVLFGPGNIGDTRELVHVGSFLPLGLKRSWQHFTPEGFLRKSFFTQPALVLEQAQARADAFYAKSQALRAAQAARERDDQRVDPYLNLVRAP